MLGLLKTLLLSVVLLSMTISAVDIGKKKANETHNVTATADDLKSSDVKKENISDIMGQLLKSCKIVNNVSMSPQLYS